MTDELVDRVVRQVLTALGREGAAARPAPAARAAGPASGGPGRSAGAESDAARRAVRTFVTAEMLLRRLAGAEGDGRVVELGPEEFLTPAARDVAEQRHLVVRRAELAVASPAPAPAPAGSPGRAPSGAPAHGDASAVGLVLQRPSETVRSVLAALRHDRLMLVDYTQTDCWVCNVRLLCEAVVGGTVGRGAVLLPHAADAMVLANKVRGIRAVQGTGPEAVAAGLRHFGANLLVVEHTASTFHEMRAMVRAFSAGPAGAPSASLLMENIAELEAH